MSLSRRRLLAVSAAAGCTAVFRTAEAGAASPPVRWQGRALGTTASLAVHGHDPAHAAAVIGRCLVELARLERIFSLYDPASQVSRLNAAGRLEAPAGELVDCLATALRVGRASQGALDVTVQPLWDLYARHHAVRDAGPLAESAIAGALARVGQDGLSLSRDVVRFRKPGMAITLNGLAQGYITDRIVALLHESGYDSVLVDMGEIAGRGGHPDGGPWRVGLAADDQVLDLRDLAVATSSGAGTPFSADGRDHHLFDPRSGRSANRWASVSVVAGNATTADALSKPATILPFDHACQCLAEGGAVAAYFKASDGSALSWHA